MSQYNIQASNPAHQILVGWDKPLKTYFATVLAEENDEEVVLLSQTFKQPALLATALVDGGFAAAIPTDIMHSLWSDRDGVAF